MSRLLYIESSPRKERSASIAVTAKFLDSFKKAHPNDEVLKLDLWNKELPPFNGETIAAKYAIMSGKEHTEGQKKAWEPVVRLIEEFKQAEYYLFSLPMWNFGIPYRLKHYIDLLVQPGYAFTFSPQEGYKGLITGKKAVLICARGGAYGAGTGAEAFDLQVPYMRTILQFIGFTDITNILVEPTIGPEGAKEQAISKVSDIAIKTASSL
jgi:FMN-dependent NADH-azoreductase